MSNGGAESTSGRLKADEFGHAVAKKAVAQICENVGFDGSKESALDALTDVTIRYLRDLGKTASSNANLCGRAECSIFDVVQGLEDISTSQGFPGAFDSSSCLVSSSTIGDIIDYVGSDEEEIPFAQPVPKFPIVRASKLIPSFNEMNETPPGKHVPGWLPALPDPHTYVHTPMWNERASDPRAEKIEQARQRRKGDRALLSLQQRLVNNGLVGASSSENVVNGNPFLAQPLKAREKDVSEVSVPNNPAVAASHVSVMEAFAPAIEAAKEVEVDEGDDGEKKLLLEKRPNVNFRLTTRKKLLVESVDLHHLWKKGEGRKGKSSLGREDERDDKKRRAEFILKQSSMENSQELTH
ncbi:Transcription initiation factor TFIID subunit 8 [Linum perenne]